MNQFLDMLSFDQKAGPPVDKVIRDADVMYSHARYVIVLNEIGVVTERINRSVGYLANCLVVIAPTYYKNHFVYSVVMEIGIGRTVPYVELTRQVMDSISLRVNSRNPVAQLTYAKTLELLSVLSDVLQGIVDEGVAHRKKLVWVKTGKDNKELPIGIFIAIPRSLSPLVYACLEKDFTTRVEGHISVVIQLIKDDLNTLRFAYYPDKELKRLKAVDKVAHVLSDAKYPEHFLEVIRNSLGKRTKKVRALFEQIIDSYKIPVGTSNENDELYLKLREDWYVHRKMILAAFRVSVQAHPKRDAFRSSHAKNCIRVEIHPSEEAIRAKHPNVGRY